MLLPALAEAAAWAGQLHRNLMSIHEGSAALELLAEQWLLLL